MTQNSARSSLMLGFAALIWGLAFVAQSVGMDYVGAFTFNASRFLIGGIVLIPCIFFLNKNEKGKEEIRFSDAEAVKGGILCGIVLFAASSFQQIGIGYTTVGKAGFVTAMYIVIVPIFSIFLGRRAHWNLWLSVAIAVAGLYMLCISEEFSIGFGDELEFICAIFFSVQILLIDHFSPLTDGVKISCVQFFTCGILSVIPAVIFETIDFSQILAAWAPILYAGIFSCGVAYTLQVIGQRDLDPRIASLIMSLESVFSLIGGWIILGQTMSGRELFGCFLMFFAIILAQIPEVSLSSGTRSQNE